MPKAFSSNIHDAFRALLMFFILIDGAASGHKLHFMVGWKIVIWAFIISHKSSLSVISEVNVAFTGTALC